MSEKSPKLDRNDEPSTYVENIDKAEVMAHAENPDRQWAADTKRFFNEDLERTHDVGEKFAITREYGKVYRELIDKALAEGEAAGKEYDAADNEQNNQDEVTAQLKALAGGPDDIPGNYSPSDLPKLANMIGLKKGTAEYNMFISHYEEYE